VKCSGFKNNECPHLFVSLLFIMKLILLSLNPNVRTSIMKYVVSNVRTSIMKYVVSNVELEPFVVCPIHVYNVYILLVDRAVIVGFTGFMEYDG
jgi:hypothetical protein